MKTLRSILAISVNGQRRYTLRSDNDAMGKSKFVFDADFNYYRLSAGYIKEYYMANADTSTMAIRPWSHVFRSAHYAYK